MPEIVKITPKAGCKTIYDHLLTNHDANHYAYPCGGHGTCGKCRVKVISGAENLTPPVRAEMSAVSAGYRLACLAEVLGEVTVEVSGEGEIKVETESFSGAAAEYSPRYTLIEAALEKPSLENPISLDENLARSVEKITSVRPKIPFGIKKEIAASGTNECLTVMLRDGSAVCAVGRGELYGIAADIGTTTIAVYLVSLPENRVIGTAAGRNPQSAYGADVITRIGAAGDSASLLKQKSAVLGFILEKTSELCEKNGVNSEDIIEFVLVGNTVMQHLAAGIQPKSIASSPFYTATLFDFSVNLPSLTTDTGCSVSGFNPYASVYFPPAVASYIGADITAGVIASGTHNAEKNRLYIDVGTNGEMGIKTETGLTFCSTAAGPAFEGANITLGMSGVNGAADKIFIRDGGIDFTVIGGGEPRGICGSGIIDAAAVMLETGAIDESGRIPDAEDAADEMLPKYKNLASNIGEVNGENAFFFDRERRIYLTQKDIREIQLAKSAIRAGIETLLEKCRLAVSDIDEVILAGGFGSRLSKSSACKIGMIPPELEQKIIPAGNTAGAGAVLLLISREAVNSVRNLRPAYIELSGDPFFMDSYVENMLF